MSIWYGDVEVLERRRVRVAVTCEGKMTKAKMLKALQTDDIDDCTDEESLEVTRVLKLDGSFEE